MFSSRFTLVAASFIVGLSFIVGCFVLRTGESPLVQTTGGEKAVMTLGEAAAALNMTEAQVKLIISSEERDPGDERMKLPYFNINSDLYISRAGLLAWIEAAAAERRHYTGETIR
ncbi:hypothetical protein [Paenibacillus methanolicus]|uniref:Uncharacterized protein n=1 Tax=Paenibacillus methanolicus TaxID=582686 RepID=A0A5S5C3K0_9BACL|nr:hypothetical protein [Paenibacillus methanolicus]TYP74001.1 hypothetical protein BCM02_106282 [Paenibacillus methanolicus]